MIAIAKGVFHMFTNHSLDMFGLPPMRDYVSISGDVFESDLPGWARDEQYDNCTGGASWLYRFLKK